MYIYISQPVCAGQGGEILYNQISIDEIAREEIVDFTNIFQEWGPDI